ncbi:preprotein translocase subunit YajC [Bifidobacterium asteroides]|uniref:Preprotein translocase subunit YajC n=1 Tax=Bifidobacterium asteroides TaxID=1684 RepID=A0A318M400_9BIFI|nr:preprotein translocase subunit YajC [Bifidobacterium asteroides]PXY82808.1 preprotein translocase subunit YajC [Bifidobacterium asteroides]
MGSMIFMIAIIALMIAMMWGSSRKSKQQQAAVQDFRQSLQPGDEVATASGLLGKIVSVDLEKEQVVIDSEGSQSRWRIQAITQPPIVPAYVHDDEVDENGNPLPEQDDDQSKDADAPVLVTDADGNETASDDTAAQDSQDSDEESDKGEHKNADESGSNPEQKSEGESDKTETAEKSDDADGSEASKDSESSDSTSAKS